MQDLKVTIIQTALVWQDNLANIEKFSALVDSINEPTDLIVLPETFNTGFTMNSELASETMDGPTVNWLKETARKKHVSIMGSLIIRENGGFYNRIIIANQNGSFHQYDKRHLFRMGDEHLHFKHGTQRLIFELKGWKICPLICYDLRFPVWSRNDKHYDCLIYVANWPEARKSAWKDLLKARAHENLCYVIGANRIGIDGNNVNCIGNSAVINFKGEYLFEETESKEIVKTVTLSKKALLAYREKFPALLDADTFNISN